MAYYRPNWDQVDRTSQQLESKFASSGFLYEEVDYKDFSMGENLVPVSPYLSVSYSSGSLGLRMYSLLSGDQGSPIRTRVTKSGECCMKNVPTTIQQVVCVSDQ